MAEVTVVVRHRLTGAERRTTRLTFDVPENIEPENVDSFVTAMIHRTAAVHAEDNFGALDPLFVHAFRVQVITGLLERAKLGPHRRLAERILRVLRLRDSQLLQQHANGVRGENAG